jgi:type II secretory pathway component PulK
MRDRAGRRPHDERGFALLVVLLVLALIAVVGAEFSYSMRLEASAVRAYKNGIIGNHLAETALGQAIREIVADAPLVAEDDDGLLTFYTVDRRALPRLRRAKAELLGGRDGAGLHPRAASSAMIVPLQW